MDEPASAPGEWTARGHVDFGPGPTPDRDEFLDAVRTLLARPGGKR